MQRNLLSEISAEMRKPGFYGHPVDAVELRETHISKVFLAGEFVYKIKKPLNLGFLDFTSLEKREFFCNEEVRLNRRLTSGIYLDVVPITYTSGSYHLDSGGRIVEYAVKMRKLPDDCTMARLMETNDLDQNKLDCLLDVLTEFHHSNDDQGLAVQCGSWEVVFFDACENFSQTESFAGNLFDEDLFKIVRSATTGFLRRRKTLFDRRLVSGKIKDCHGDLRLDHVYFIDGRVQIIDCIEFNQRFRYGDVASDLAFLIMDMESKEHPDEAGHLLAQYCRRTGDADIFLLIDFYKCYRAMVRFKVNCFRVLEANVGKPEKTRLLYKISKYLNLAYGHATRLTRRCLWVVCGLPASGKSTIAWKIGEALEISVIQSDMVRKGSFATDSKDLSHLGFETGIYSKGKTALTYGRLLLMAQEHLKKGLSVVLDATFGSSHFRGEALRLAGDMGAHIIFVECTAPEAVLKKRLLSRNSNPSLSDARMAHLDAIRNRFEPLEEIHPEHHIAVETQKSVDKCIRLIFQHRYDPLSIKPEAIT